MQDASLKGGCLIGKRDNCVGGAVILHDKRPYEKGKFGHGDKHTQKEDT